MENLSLFNQFESLPGNLKKEVLDFIASLKRKLENDSPEIKKRKFGVLKGKIKMSPDFDAPLEDFNDYM